MGVLSANRPIQRLPWGGLTANMLRVLALALMLGDHIWATAMNLGDWMTHLGRLAFPIFAFQIAEGFVHTSDWRKYARRLGVFALMSEIPFNLFYSSRLWNPFHQNVMFTLLLGLLAIVCIDKAKQVRTGKQMVLSAVWLLLIALASVIGFPDYGIAGVMTVVLFYVCRDIPFAWLGQLAGMVLIHMVLAEGLVFPVSVGSLTLEIPAQGFAVAALIPIWLYGGRKGRSSKWLQYGCYAFYPLHMLVLSAIRLWA